MTAVDGDGIDQDLTRAVSAAMIAAARAAEQIARMNQTAARQCEARTAGDTIEAQRQLDAHTESARAYFEVVTRPEYLTAATDVQIQEVAQQARAWRERLPAAQRAANEAIGQLGARQLLGERAIQKSTVLLGAAAASSAASTAEAAQARPAWEVSATGNRSAVRSHTWRSAQARGRSNRVEL